MDKYLHIYSIYLHGCKLSLSCILYYTLIHITLIMCLKRSFQLTGFYIDYRPTSSVLHANTSHF